MRDFPPDRAASGSGVVKLALKGELPTAGRLWDWRRVAEQKPLQGREAEVPAAAAMAAVVSVEDRKLGS